MGAYVNPGDLPKEVWLEKKGIEMPEPKSWDEVPAGGLMVCLVNNGPFTAAAIAYSPRELEEFKRPQDHRPKKWYFCLLEDLHKVSPELKSYLRL